MTAAKRSTRSPQCGTCLALLALLELNQCHLRLWVPETRCTLCGLLIFVELSAESIAPSDVVDLGSGALRQRS
jgi:hypothetical protein